MERPRPDERPRVADVITLRPAPEPLLRDVLGASLRSARRERRLTLAQVSDRAGVSVAYLSEIERGRKEPSSEIVAALCRGLDLSLPHLLADCLAQLQMTRERQRPRELRPLRVRPQRPDGVTLMLAA